MKALLACLLLLVTGLYAHDHLSKKAHKLDPAKDAVVLKSGAVVIGKVVERDGRVAVLLDNADIDRVVKSSRPERRPQARQVPAPAAVDQNVCQHCNGKGYIENNCPSCNGTGTTRCPTCFGDGYDYKNCPVCHGTGWCWGETRDGRKQQVQCHCREGDPKQNMNILCPDCKGTGQIPCKACGGTGKMQADCPCCVGGKTR